MLSLIKSLFTTTFVTLKSSFNALFKYTTIDAQALQELEKILLQADVGIATTKNIIERVKQKLGPGNHDGAALHGVLEAMLYAMLTQVAYKSSSLFLLVGINGSGKTTAAAKLAYQLKREGKKVLLVAADTFRAAAVTQLQEWAKRIDIDCFAQTMGSDPSAVIFQAAQRYKEGNYTALIVDTAGRLQTKTNLMKELEKMKRVLSNQCQQMPITTLLTIDAMLGQNSLDQAKLFYESTTVDGIILTKLDATAKGGSVFAMVDCLNIPIAYISTGESVDSWGLFDAREFVHSLLTFNE